MAECLEKNKTKKNARRRSKGSAQQHMVQCLESKKRKQRRIYQHEPASSEVTGLAALLPDQLSSSCPPHAWRSAYRVSDESSDEMEKDDWDLEPNPRRNNRRRHLKHAPPRTASSLQSAVNVQCADDSGWRPSDGVYAPPIFLFCLLSRSGAWQLSFAPLVSLRSLTAQRTRATYPPPLPQPQTLGLTKQETP